MKKVMTICHFVSCSSKVMSTPIFLLSSKYVLCNSFCNLVELCGVFFAIS
jgi:hypothetical protein